METAVKDRLRSVRFGAVQAYRNVAILPLILPADGTFQYRTLGEALAAWEIAITEVSADGSVSELMVVSRATKPILLIDGEALGGAKQNRVVNASILIKELCETRIPVSGTEPGRWSYSSRTLNESDHVMAHSARARKACSVRDSLEEAGVYRSDQREIWETIAKLEAKAGAVSPTCAMSDVFKAQAAELRRCLEAFPCVPAQVGLLAIIDGQVAGMDVVSLASAYAELHAKLVRGYALPALLESRPRAATPDTAAVRGGEFLAEIRTAAARPFPSVGYGTDVRFKARGLAGSALVHDGEVIHAAFFRLNGRDAMKR